ncbi:hypothetical protein FGO68_gene1692 [Halteria grandinella]|uniref:Pectinesterase inhibitor domain-containing protein n=1 Tax=Halteria grandinella TaxID=5974 RepID=A0A8J8NLB8_HALGN|nr:hypothetical protein FGO68_gene1692 [Halteria grandinella]
MKSLFAVLAVLGLATVSRASVIADVGTAIGDLNVGLCLAFQDDVTDETTTCYDSCISSAANIATMFDADDYTDGSFNAAELLQYAQEASITLLTQFNDCQTTEVFYGIDNRLSDLAFTLGTASNVGTQIATTMTYYFYTDDDYQNIGLVLGSFFKSIINFSAPNTST